MDVRALAAEIVDLCNVASFEEFETETSARVAIYLTDFEAQVRADERKSPTITKLVEALREAHKALKYSPSFAYPDLVRRIEAALAELEKP